MSNAKGLFGHPNCQLLAWYDCSKCRNLATRLQNGVTLFCFIFTKNQIQITLCGPPEERKIKNLFPRFGAKVCAKFCQNFGHQFGDELESTKYSDGASTFTLAPRLALDSYRKLGSRSARGSCQLFKRVELGNRTRL